MSADAKDCDYCGREFFKRVRDSQEQWNGRRFCSRKCSSNSKEIEPLHIRFWRYVDKSGAAGCWLWTGSTSKGYGQLSTWGGEQNYKAHRLAWELMNGPVPDGLVVRHKCDNPRCVNPSHLEVGTQKDNSMDTSRRGRLNPKSFLNLRPGAPGFHGAGPTANATKRIA